MRNMEKTKKKACYSIVLFFILITSIFIKPEKTHAATYVARIGEAYFESLDDALGVADYFGGGCTIHVLNNCTVDEINLANINSPLVIMPEGGNWTVTYQDKDGDSSNGIVNGAGHADNYLIGIYGTGSSGCSMTLSGNGSYTITFNAVRPANMTTENADGSVSMDSAIVARQGATLNIASGVVIDGPDHNIWCVGVNVTSGSHLNMSGGTIYSTGVALQIGENSTANISGGVIGSSIFGLFNAGTTTISGGTIYNNHGNNVSSLGTGILTVSGGSIYSSSTQSGIDNDNNATLIVTGGNIYSNALHGINNRGTLRMSGNAYVNTNNDIFLDNNSIINVNGALNNATVGKITPTSYTLLKNLATVSYSGGNASSILSKFSLTANSSYPTYHLLASGNNLVITKDTTVSLNANGGTCSASSYNTTYYTSMYYNVSGWNPKRTGYSFTGWYDANGNQVYNSSGVSVNGTGYWTNNIWVSTANNVALTAKWTANQYTVTLYPNGGTCGYSSFKTTYNSTNNYSISKMIPTRAGYNFVGWYTAASGGTQIYNKNGVCVNDGTYWKSNKCIYAGNYKLYAHWEPKVYTVNYHVNGGNTVNGEAKTVHKGTVTYTKALDLSIEATKDKYKFIGWGFTPDAPFIIESLDEFIFGTSEAYENYIVNGELNLYALYSVEVSDIEACYFAIWNISDPEGTYAYYEMEKVETLDGGYKYSISGDYTEKLKNTKSADVDYCVFAMDHAKNVGLIVGQFPSDDDGSGDNSYAPAYHEQTTIHQVWDMDAEEYVEFNRTIEIVEEGTNYTTSYIDELLTWHDAEVELTTYKVNKANTNVITYKPKKINISLDPCGGTMDEDFITVYMNAKYGQFPIVTREGYDFAGWFTQPEKGGQKILSNQTYPYPSAYPNAGPLTLYAAWDVQSYDVTYDYESNGGTTMDIIETEDQKVAYDENINLSYIAEKPGYEFIGWSLDPTELTPLTSLKMGTENVTLYAHFKKTVSFEFISMDDTTVLTDTVYDKDTFASVNAPVIKNVSPWKAVGWAIAKDVTDGNVNVGSGTRCTSEVDITYYAVYEKEISVSYETNHPEVEYQEETGKVIYNSSGTTNPFEVALKEMPELENFKFLHWEVNGVPCNPGDVIELTDTTEIRGKWDAKPDLVVNEQYYTLQQANDGEITQSVILSDVSVTDIEDDAAGKTISLKLENYIESELLNLTDSADIAVTVVATDSVGSEVRKNMLLHIVNSAVEEDTRVMSTRFIDKNYFNTDVDGVYVDEQDGGLRNDSVWKNEEAYISILEYALSNQKKDIAYKTVTIGNTTTEVPVSSSGEWEHCYATYSYTHDEIKEIKDFVLSKGFAKYKSFEAFEEFLQLFMEE